MSYSIGIDLGTTNSVVCVWRRGMVKTVPVEGRPTLPSTVSVKPDGSVLVGQMAKSRALLDPAQSVSSAKRVIGDGVTTWTLHGKVYTPTDISALVIQRLKAAAEAYLGEPVTDAVITVPAYFNNNQKEATKKAGEEAGLRVLQLLPEPTAAAISYGLDKGRDQTILVYDLGGGTFDVSLLKVKGNRFEVIAVDGDFHLGGDDFDNLLVEYLIRRLKSQANEADANFDVLKEALDSAGRAGVSPQVLQARLRLKEVAENAKKELSEAEVTRVTVPEILGTSLDEEITLETYNQLIAPLVEYSLTKVQDVLKAAGLSADEIDRVILVGGSTRNKLVKQRVAEAIKEPYTAERVDEVVAQGAAIVAASLSLPQEDDLTPAELGPLPPIEFRDVTPFSLGVCALKDDRSRYINSVILQQNREVPCREMRAYALDTRPGTGNRLEVYMLQGESEDPTECLALGRYVFSDVTHQPNGRAEVAIQYGYDESGIITVSAVEQATGKTLPLSIEPLPANPPWRETLPRAQAAFDPQSLKLFVTMRMYDDIAKVLKSMNLPFKKYTSVSDWKESDILFINCGTLRHPRPKELREYAQRGGCIYASDLEADIIQEAFSEQITFRYRSCRKETVRAEVMDPEIAALMGTGLDIYYDVAACYEVTKMGPSVQVILRNQQTKEPIMVMFPVGERGKVFYTLFHNHAQASKQEEELLQLLLMKQISAVSGIPIEIVRQAIQG